MPHSTCYFFILKACEEEIRQREADVKIPLTSDLKHSHLAPWTASQAYGCTSAYRSQQKGEKPVTRDYYQLTHEIADQGARRGGSGAQIEPEPSVVPCLTSPPDKRRGRKKKQNTKKEITRCIFAFCFFCKRTKVTH